MAEEIKSMGNEEKELGENENERSIGESGEDYLKAIYMQIKKNGACRPTDIATYLNCSKPSVSIALKKLEHDGYIIRADWNVRLTEKGMEIASEMYRKHSFFKAWLIMSGVDESIAEEEACRMEHALSNDSFDKICRLMKEVHGESAEELVSAKKI